MRELFVRALSVPLGNREAFVRREAGADDALCESVLAMLRACAIDTQNVREQLAPPAADLLTSTNKPPLPVGGVGEQVHSTATGELMQRLARAPKLDSQRFTLEGELGKGGMGLVLRVHDQFLNRRLAMKVLIERSTPRDAEEQRLVHQLLGRFLEEAQVTSQLDHPGVVPVHELGLDQAGKVFFTMRMVKGRTASDVFADAYHRRGEWDLTRALEVILKVCDTMAYAHDKGVLHRDLKPSNVMVGRFGEVYVMDWGLAKVLGQQDRHDLRICADHSTGISRLQTARKLDADSDLDNSVVSMDGQQLGTPSYMSPEQARSEDLDARADVYSIGAMMYELVTGSAPYAPRGLRQPAYRILRDVVEGPPRGVEDLAKDVPVELVAVIDRAMARERDQRYRSMQELAADVRAFLAQRVVRAYRTGAWQEMKLWTRRNKPLAASLASAAMLLIGGVGVAVAFASAEARAKEDALTQKQVAELHARTAEAREQAGRRDLYFASIVAATTALDRHEYGNARKLLAAAPTEERAWEWFYLSAEVDTSTSNRKLGGRLTASTLGAKGKVARADWDEAVLWIEDAASGRVLNRVPVPVERPHSMGFSADERHILLTSGIVRDGIVDDSVAAIVDVETGDIAWRREGAWRVHLDSSRTRVVMQERQGEPAFIMDLAGKVVGRADGARAPFVFHPSGDAYVMRDDGALRVLESGTGRDLCALVRRGSESLGDPMFGPDGSLIVADVDQGEGGNACVHVWSASDGGLLAALKAPEDLVDAYMYPLSFSIDGKLLATKLSSEGWRGVCVWECATWRLVAKIDHDASAVVFSPDGRWLVTWDMVKKEPPRVWETARWRLVRRLQGVDGQVRHVAFLDIGGEQLLATLEGDNDMRIWEPGWNHTPSALPSGSKRLEGAGYPLRMTRVKDAQFSPDSQRIYGLSDNGLEVWSCSTESSLGILSRKLSSFAISPSGSRLLDARTEEQHWTPDWVSMRKNFRIEYPSLEISANTGALAGVVPALLGQAPIRYTAGGVAFGFKVRSGGADVRSLFPEAVRNSASALALEEMAIYCPVQCDGLSRHAVVAREDGMAVLVDVSKATIIREVGEVVVGSRLGCCEFSSDGDRLLTVDQKQSEVVLWDCTDPVRDVLRIRARNWTRTGHVEVCKFSRDGKLFACIDGGDVLVLESGNGGEVAKLTGHGGQIKSVAFCPGGERIVTSSEDGTVRVWHVRSGRLLLTLALNGDPESAGHVCFSPDGSMVMCMGQTLHVWSGVPRSERYGRRVAAQREAGPVVERVFRDAETPETAEKLIENSLDLGVDGRRAALDMLLTRAWQAREDARQLVEDLVKKRIWASRVREEIQTKRLLGGWSLKEALSMLEELGDEPDRLHGCAHDVVCNSDATAEEFGVALAALEATRPEKPTDDYLCYLGAAYARCGRHAEAVEKLAPLTGVQGWVRTRALSFLAISYYHLGRKDEASTRLAELEKVPEGSRDSEDEKLLLEVRALVGAR